MPISREKFDFFISYTKADQQWAEWIAWILEDAEYKVILQAWDFRAGHNFISDMNSAIVNSDRIIAILSPNYLNASFTQPEWQAAFVRDPTGILGTLVPIRVEECNLEGLLESVVYIDLVGQDEMTAQQLLLSQIVAHRHKPVERPVHPGKSNPSLISKPSYPSGVQRNSFSEKTAPVFGAILAFGIAIEKTARCIFGAIERTQDLDERSKIKTEIEMLMQICWRIERLRAPPTFIKQCLDQVIKERHKRASTKTWASVQHLLRSVICEIDEIERDIENFPWRPATDLSYLHAALDKKRTAYSLIAGISSPETDWEWEHIGHLSNSIDRLTEYAEECVAIGRRLYLLLEGGEIEKSELMRTLAVEQIRAGDYENARRTTLSIKEVGPHDSVWREIISTEVLEGRLNEAVLDVLRMRGPVYQDEVRRHIILREQLKGGQLAEALSTANAIHTADDKAFALVEVGETAIQLGQKELGRGAIVQALEIADRYREKRPNVYRGDLTGVRWRVATQFGRLGDLSAAIRTAESTLKEDRDHAFERVAEECLKNGNLAVACELAGRMKAGWAKDSLLARIARAEREN